MVSSFCLRRERLSLSCVPVVFGEFPEQIFSSRSKETRPAAGPRFKDCSVDLLDHPALTGLHDIGAIVAVDVAIFAQRGRLAIDGLRKLFDFHGIRHTLAPADFDPARTAAAGGAPLGGGPGVPANDV